jgi:hypothetical protein
MTFSKSKPKPVSFRDRIAWDGAQKNAISMRDGVVVYRGEEIGVEPHSQTFRVYRSPATVANAAHLLVGVPLTDEHVALDAPPQNAVGRVDASRMVDLRDSDLMSTVGVHSLITVTPAILGALNTGKRELSLGYHAGLVPCSIEGAEFEQVEIVPHHLAVVTQGRCGPSCSFVDKKSEPELMKRIFFDEAGQLNLEAVADVLNQLPDAMRKMPLEKLQALLPVLQEAVKTAQGGNPAEQGAVDSEKPKDEAKSEEAPAEGDKKVEAKDSKSAADKKEEVPMKDSAEFKNAVQDAIKSEVSRRDEVIEHAQQFLDSSYRFVGKSTEQIMRDALATEYGSQKFSDTELATAFKLLKRRNTLKNFGDNASTTQGRFSAALGDKEI